MPTVSFRSELLSSGTILNGFETGDQIGPDVVGLSNGGFAVAYGNDLAGSNDTALVTFYDADFNQVSAFSTPFSDSDVFLLGAPEITQLDNGNVVVTWIEGPDGDDGLLAAIFTDTGEVISTDIQISGVVPQGDPAIAALSGGGFVSAWQSNGDVFFSVRTDTGESSSATTSFNAGVGVTGLQSDVQVTGLSNGNFVVTFTNNTAGVNGGQDQVIATVFDGDTFTAINSGIVVASSGASNQSEVAALSNGNFVVVSASNNLDGTSGIEFSTFDASGNLVSGPTRVDTQLSDAESDPAVTVLENDFIVISWTDPSSAGDIISRIYDGDGNLVNINGTGILSQTATASADEFSSLGAITGGIFAIAFQDSALDSDGGSIGGQVVEIVRDVTGDSSSELIEGDELRDDVTALGGDDTILGDDGADILRGNGGDDSIDGGNGDDTLFGGNDDDFIRGLNDADLIIGGSGADTLLGNAGNDDIRGGNDSDSLFGGNGDDIVTGADGDDFVTGGAGNDTVVGSDGFDTLRGDSPGASVFGDDSITGGANDDFLLGAGGTDTLNGGGGNDTVAGQDGDDLVLGSTGNDLLNGNAGVDTLRGGNGADEIFGGDGNDSLNGGIDADTLNGGLNDDFLSGDAGNDVLQGGNGNDTFFFNDGLTDDDTILDFTAGSGTDDVIELSGFGLDSFSEVIAAATQSGSDVVIDLGGGESITLLGTQVGDLDQDDFIFG